ncbi:unnamed protein product [Protopolystoma xenopodis]|uniref:Uncharacterized protein n=1 Tax=Protopolystoma xenopodis TaxID=117903 RepID=A0A448WYY6_9PLAT|nr:unnamed protein product [Protopolystoma xenopodis]
MGTERSEIDAHIALTCCTNDWHEKTEDQGSCDYPVSRIPDEEEIGRARVGKNFAHCLDELGDSAKTAKRRLLLQRQLFNNRIRYRQEETHKGDGKVEKRRFQ